jgi:hypothetical protein
LSFNAAAPRLAALLLSSSGVKTTLRTITTLCGVSLLVLACATGPRPRADSSARAKDTVPDKIAAQRAATPGLQLGREDDRWGFEAARERRRADDQKKKQQQQPSVSSAPVQTGPADLRETPVLPPAPPPP